MKKRNELLIILFSLISFITTTYANERDSLAHLLTNKGIEKLEVGTPVSLLKKKEISILTIPARPLFEPVKTPPSLATISDDVEKELLQKLQQSYQVTNDPSDDVRSSVGGLLDDELTAIARAREVIQGLTAAGNFISTLTGADLVQLPVGIKQEVGNITYILGIGDIKLKSTYAELEVYLSVDAPQFETPLIFGASDVKFSKNGGIVGGARLGLLGDFPIDIEAGKSIIILKAFGDSGGCYADVDCNGLLGLGVEADVIFSRDWVKPTDDQGTVLPFPQRVQGNFSTTLEGWEDLIVDVSLPNFVINGVEDVGFSLDKAVFDFSSKTTPGDVIFPTNYESPFADEMGKPTANWEGFYMNQLVVTLPEQFSNNGGTRIQAELNNLIIDDGGISTLFKLNNLLPINEGNINGWAFSIDTFKLDVVRNQFRESGLAGELIIPLFSEEDAAGNPIYLPENNFEYSAIINPGNQYLFSISPLIDHEYPIKMLKAKATLAATSSLTLEYTDGEFVAEAILNGALSIDGEFTEGKRLNLPAVTFENFTISNQKNYIKNVGNWGNPGNIPVTFGAFKLVVSGIDIADGSEEGEMQVKLNTKIILAGEEEEEEGGGGINITANGGFRIIGMVDDNLDKHNWKYKALKIDSLSVEADGPGFFLKGTIVWFEDAPIYGSGFRGDAELKIKGINKDGGTSIAAMALFGTVGEGTEGYRYFFVDAYAKFGSGIPLGGISLNALGGGVYHHMSRTEFLVPLSNAKTGITALPGLGESLSGITYQPDKATRLGIKATVILSSEDEETFNINGTFYIDFNSANEEGEGGGIGRIGLGGVVNFMAPISWDSEPPCEGIGVKLDMEYVNQTAAGQSGEKGFHAIADVYMETNSVWGNSLHSPHTNLSCPGVENYAGRVELLFSNTGWFINIGNPDIPIDLFVAVSGFQNSDGLDLTAYLDIGTKIPPFPGLPDNVRSLTGLSQLLSNQSRRATGRGFAFGASINFHFDKTFLAFYGKFDLGGGFDIMLQKYGEVICENTGQVIGVKRLYGNGQIYGYFDGEFGIDLKLFGKSERFPVITAGFAAALQARLPNPFWARGAVGGRFSVLGGLVRGKFNYQFTIGSNCEQEGGDIFSEIDIISSLSPNNESEEIFVSEVPNAVLLLPLNEPIRENGETYNISPGTIALTNTSDNSSIAGEVQIDETGTFIEFIPAEMLPANASLKFNVEVIFKKVIDGNYTVINTQKKEVIFTTGVGFTVIPEENVAAAYPMLGQYNFYKEEAPGNNYIKLVKGQQDLFNNIPLNSQLKARVYESGNTDPVQEVNFSYESGAKKIIYSLNGGSLTNEVYHKIDFVVIPEGNSALGVLPFDAELGKGPDPSNYFEMDRKLNNSTEEESEEAILYTLYFRTSKYNTLIAKLEARNESIPVLGIHYTAGLTGIEEDFDKMEIRGNLKTDPLVQLSANGVLNTPWYQQSVGEMELYDHIPFTDGVPNKPGVNYNIQLNRDEELLGDPPVKDVFFSESSSTLQVEETDFDAPPSIPASSSIRIDYDILELIGKDMMNIFQNLNIDLMSHHSVNDQIDWNGVPARGLFMKKIFYENGYSEPRRNVDDYRIPLAGKYPLEIKYKLPGTDIITTEYVIEVQKN